MTESSNVETAPAGPGVQRQPLQEAKADGATRPWERHYEEGVPVHLTVPDLPLTWLLQETARRFPHHTACIYYGTKLTYAQLSSYASRFARVLRSLGVEKGDRVAIALPNIPQYPIAFYGALAAGAVVVPTNPLYTQREMQHQLADSGARVVVMLDTFYPVVQSIRAQTSLEHVILASPADFLPPVLKALYLLTRWRKKGLQSPPTFKELHGERTVHNMRTLLKVDAGREGEPLSVPLEADELAVLQYTGGTTGLSKGAVLSHRNLLANALQTRAWVAKACLGEEVILCVAPFFHAYGMTVCMNLSMLIAGTMVLLPRFETKAVVKAIQRYHPTLFPGIPTMYLAIIRGVGRHRDGLRSIKYCISGAAPLPTSVRADFEAITGGRLVEGYGLSEAGPVTHCNPLTQECRNGSIGLPFPDVEAAIVGQETGEPVPIGEVGELVVRGPNVMQGYWKRDEETRMVLRNGWLHTGDLGKMDEDGYFYIVERAKDVIIASGFKVFPREVEEVLSGHPAVAEAAVAGVPDAYRGETVAAFVVLKAGVEASEKTKRELLEYCHRELAAYKVPKLLEFRGSLPRSLIGKVLRRELRVTRSTGPAPSHA